MARVSVNGVGVHYEVEGSGPPLVLQHGLTDSLVTWHEYGYVDALAPRFQLVLIDARGHGQSDKPHDPAAYGGAMARDVVAVLDDLGLGRAAYFGHSMGGRIGIWLAHLAPNRISALGIGASAPDQERTETVSGFTPLLRQGPAAMLTAWQQLGEISPELTERILAIDCAAILALLQTHRVADEPDCVALDRFPGSYRFFMGDGDWNYADMVTVAGRLRPGSLVTIPGVNHLEFFQRSDLLVPELLAFLSAVGS